MANDNRLPIDVDNSDADHALPDSGLGGALSYVSQGSGNIEFRRQPLPYQIRGAFDPQNSNSIVIPMRIRATDFHKAIPNILGFHVSGGPNGSFKRRLPIKDEQGLGMVAVKITGMKFHGQSKIKAGRSTLFWRDGVDVQSDPNRVIPFFDDGCYDSNNQFNDASSRNITALRQVRYVILDVVFAHVPFNVISDTTIADGGINEFGANDERARYCWSSFDLGVEYVTSKALALKFANVAEVPAALRGTGCSTESGYLRPTGELTVHWEYIPRDSAAILSQKFEARIGMVNNASFSVPLYGEVRSYDEETLLFMGYKNRDLMQSHGVPFHSFDLKFSYRRDGWNKFLTGRYATPLPVVRIVDDSEPYTSTTFTELFRAA